MEIMKKRMQYSTKRNVMCVRWSGKYENIVMIYDMNPDTNKEAKIIAELDVREADCMIEALKIAKNQFEIPTLSRRVIDKRGR